MNGIVATVEPTRRRSQRLGLNTSCSSSAQRYASSRMPRPYGCASVSTVIQSAASRAARRRSCQVRSGSSVTRRSRMPKANQRTSSGSLRNRRSAMYRSVVGDWPLVAPRKPRATAALSGQRTPSTGPRPGATRRSPSWYSGSASRAKPASSSRAKASGSWTPSASERPSASACPRCAATKATARAVVSLRGRIGGHRGHRPAPIREHRCRRGSRSAAWSSRFVRPSREVGGLGGREDGAVRRVHDRARGRHETPPLLGDPALGPDRSGRRGPGA